MVVHRRMDLAQTYGQIIMGFLTEAIVKYEAYRTRKSRQEIPKAFGELESLVIKLESPYGQLNLDPAIKEGNYLRPLISWDELLRCMHTYAERHRIEFNKDTFCAVVDDMETKLGILTPVKKRKGDTIYAINTQVIGTSKIDEKCYSLEQGLSNGLIKDAEGFYFSEEDAKGDWSEEAVQRKTSIEVSKEEMREGKYRHIAKEMLFILGNASLVKNIGRGYLYSKLFEKGAHYNDFMPVVRALVEGGVLIQAYSEEFGTEVLSINPQRKPFTITKALLQRIDGEGKERKIVLHEIRPEESYGDPMGSFINIGGSIHNKEFYSFGPKIDGPHGL